MLIENLKKEYELRYRMMKYKKLYTQCLCNVIEQHNVELIREALIDLDVSRKNHLFKKFKTH